MHGRRRGRPWRRAGARVGGGRGIGAGRRGRPLRWCARAPGADPEVPFVAVPGIAPGRVRSHFAGHRTSGRE
ncbi:hypothetical protein Ae263Ps1_5371c [Pseudonocardia sp. Ae263_Ps1]|nr:hypothetical protein Ae263Ps1_5371c [Pseudonocardia sp. Ae263_Ps1]